MVEWTPENRLDLSIMLTIGILFAGIAIYFGIAIFKALDKGQLYVKDRSKPIDKKAEPGAFWSAFAWRAFFAGGSLLGFLYSAGTLLGF